MRRVRGKKSLLIIGALALLLAACDPIPHPNFVVREGATSPVTFELLSGDGNYVVVRSTGASATVPGAGRWRVDRRNGSVTALPAGDRGTQISRDGSRVLVRSGFTTATLWSSGTALTPPAGTQFSDDLTFGVFVDNDGAVKTWKTATQSVGLVETGFPRPVGTTGAVPKGVSDDGRTVQYTLRGVSPVERFVDLDTHQVVDRPNRDGSGGSGSYTADRFVLAASGDGFVHAHEEGTLDIDVGPGVDVSWAELVSLPGGVVQQRYTNTTQEQLTGEKISANGKLAWVYQQRYSQTGPTCDIGPSFNVCVVASRATAFWGANARRQFNTGPGELGTIDISTDGRFFLIDKEVVALFGSAPRGPVRILDAFTGVETLDDAQIYLETTTQSLACFVLGNPPAGGPPCTIPAYSNRAQVSDDLRVVATATLSGKGSYEYTAAP